MLKNQSLLFAKLAFWQGVIAFVLFLCLICVPFSFFIKIFIFIFSTGRSNFRIIFFLCYLFLILSFRYFKPVNIPRHVPLFNLVLAWVIYLFGVAEYFDLAVTYNAAPNEKQQFVYNGILSSTYFYHIHNSKVVMAWLLQWLPPFINLSNYDFGLPYLYFYPSWLSALHSCLYVLFFFLTLYQLRAYQRLPLGLYALFVMTCFIVLRDQLDAGLFFRESLAAFPFYCCIQWRLWRQQDKKNLLSGLWVPIFLLLFFILLILFYYYLLPVRLWADNPLHYLILCAFLFTVCAVFDAIEKRAFGRAIKITTFFICIFAFTGFFEVGKSEGMLQFEFITQKLESGFTALVPKQSLNNVLQNPHFIIEKVTEINETEIVTAKPRQSIYLWQLGKEWNYLVNIDSVGVHAGPYCRPAHGYIMVGSVYILSSRQKFEDFSKTYGGDIVFELSPVKSNLPSRKYSLKLTLPGCTPDPREVIKAISKDLGLELSVMEIHLADAD